MDWILLCVLRKKESGWRGVCVTHNVSNVYVCYISYWCTAMLNVVCHSHLR